MPIVHRKLMDCKKYEDIFLFLLSHWGPRILLAQLLLLCLLHFFVGWEWLDVCLIIALFSLRGFPEWVAHRFLWHNNSLPVIGGRISSYISTEHRKHHLESADDGSFNFSGKMVLVITAIFFLILIFFFDARLAIDIQMSLVIYLCLYEFLHTLSHTDIQVENRWLSSIINVHRWHHQENSVLFNMGITSVFFDKILGTYRPFTETYAVQKGKKE